MSLCGGKAVLLGVRDLAVRLSCMMALHPDRPGLLVFVQGCMSRSVVVELPIGVARRSYLRDVSTQLRYMWTQC
jgi:hypothetical protein